MADVVQIVAGEIMAERHMAEWHSRRRRRNYLGGRLMARMILATAAALAVSTGAAFAAGPTAPASQQPPPNGFYSGYLFPDDGSPSGDEPEAIPVLVPPTPTGIGGLSFTHIYLYPPAEGADSGNGPG